jgi:hypothetical protein
MAFLPPIGVGPPSVPRTSPGPAPQVSSAPAEEAPAVNRGWVPGAPQSAAPASSASTGQSKDNDWIIKAGDSDEVKKEKMKKMGIQNILTSLKAMYEKAQEALKKAMQGAT